jgi:hypothetical protein
MSETTAPPVDPGEASPGPSRVVVGPDPTTTKKVIELATRSGDGLEVALNWSRRSGRVWVDVLHVATGESMTVDADPARALDVYDHPFAYCLAAHRGRGDGQATS